MLVKMNPAFSLSQIQEKIKTLKKERNKRDYYRPNNNHAPTLLILDVSWLDYHWPKNVDFFEKFTLRELLELVTCVNMEEDFDPVVWDAIGRVLDEKEERNFDYSAVSLIIEKVIELFYNEILRLFPDLDSNYIFHSWADNNAIIMKKE